MRCRLTSSGSNAAWSRVCAFATCQREKSASSERRREPSWTGTLRQPQRRSRSSEWEWIAKSTSARATCVRASVRACGAHRSVDCWRRSKNRETRQRARRACTHARTTSTRTHTHTHSCHHMRRSCVHACMHACVRTIIGARRMRNVRAQDSNADERAARRRLTCTSQETDSRQTDAKTSELQTDCESIDTERERDERNKRSHFCKRFFKQKRVEQIYLPFITSLSLSIVVIVTMSVGGRRCSPPFFSHSFRATNNDGGVFAQ